MDPEEYDLPERVKKKLQHPEKIKKELHEGKTAQEVLELSDSIMEQLRSRAQNFFEMGRYIDSADAYLFLVTMNPHKADYWIGLGLSLQMSKEFDGATEAYEMAALCQENDPVPYFYLAKCLFALHEREATLQALELAIEYADGLPEYKELKEQALKAKQLLETDIDPEVLGHSSL